MIKYIKLFLLNCLIYSYFWVLTLLIFREDYKYNLKDLKIQVKFNEDKIKRKNLHENIRKYFNFLESEASTQKNQNPFNTGRNSNNSKFYFGSNNKKTSDFIDDLIFIFYCFYCINPIQFIIIFT